MLYCYCYLIFIVILIICSYLRSMHISMRNFVFKKLPLFIKIFKYIYAIEILLFFIQVSNKYYDGKSKKETNLGLQIFNIMKCDERFNEYWKRKFM